MNSLRKAQICILSLVITAVSCRKDVPYDKKNYIGTWDNTAGNIQIVVKSNGKGGYYYTSTGAYEKIEGNVIFDGNDFSITAGFVKKKISVDTYPYKNILSMNPYKYKYIARFNGDDFTREEQ